MIQAAKPLSYAKLLRELNTVQVNLAYKAGSLSDEQQHNYQFSSSTAIAPWGLYKLSLVQDPILPVLTHKLREL